MPNYHMHCTICGDYEQWQSITVGAPSSCPDCGRDVHQILHPPRLYAVGNKGAVTRDIDQRDAALTRDLRAYKELRRQGYQPQAIDGADDLSARATSHWEINSKGIVHGPESQIQEAVEMARDITAGRA